MFRCCLPCRGGSTAPATSHPSSPESENYPNLYHSDSVHDDDDDDENRPTTDLTYTSNTLIYHSDTQPQSGTAGLPHIEEEEESHHTSPEDDCNSLKEHLITTTHRSIRIVKLQQHQQHQQHQQQRQAAAQQKRNSAGGDSDRGGSGSGANTTTGDDLTNSPSPRSKHSRKQQKGRNKSITSTSSNSESTGGASGTGNATSSALSTHLHSVTGGLLLPKMQAEQGSIGELQKYHSRYLKNRRHTLANVR